MRIPQDKEIEIDFSFASKDFVKSEIRGAQNVLIRWLVGIAVILLAGLMGLVSTFCGGICW